MPAARSAALLTLAVGLAVGFAGCGSLVGPPDADPGSDDTETVTPVPLDTPAPTTGRPTPTDRHVEGVEWYTTGPSNLGEHEEPHGVHLANDRDEPVDATLRITRAGETIFEDTYRLAPGERHRGALDYKANYTVTVTVGDRTATERVRKGMFDCNDSATMSIADEGGVTARTFSTAVACASPTETVSE